MATSKQILHKVTGQNVKLVIDGETFTCKIQDAEERKIIKERVVAYNAKPLVKEKKALIKLMTAPKEEAQKDKAITIKKVGKKAPTKTSKEAEKVLEEAPVLTKEQQIEAARKLLEENNFTVNVKQTPTEYRRRGEH